MEEGEGEEGRGKRKAVPFFKKGSHKRKQMRCFYDTNRQKMRPTHDMTMDGRMKHQHQARCMVIKKIMLL